MTDPAECKPYRCVNCRQCANRCLFRSKCNVGFYQQPIGWGGMSDCREYQPRLSVRAVLQEKV